MTMIMVNIFEAKAKLSDLLDRAAAGEQILICKRNQPVAELRPIPGPRQAPRPIGKAKGLFTIPDAFFDQLDDADLEAFDPSDACPPARTTASRAAERLPSPQPARRGSRPSKRR